MSSTPAVVAIGGGHGLAATLRAVQVVTPAPTAIVTVADDGGSSGRLRDELGIIAVGDIRHCLEAMAPIGPLAGAVGHRFESGGLDGHPAGNVLLAALLSETGDPVAAIDALASALGVAGRVLPASLEPVDLVAETDRGRVRGQVAVAASTGIRGLNWCPTQPTTPAGAIEAVGAADLVILGPGSLYTSVLAAVVPDVRDAIASSSARVLHVANLAPQFGETIGYTLADHLDAIAAHGIRVDCALVDDDAFPDEDAASCDVVRAALRTTSGNRHDIARLGIALRDRAAVTVSPNHRPTP